MQRDRYEKITEARTFKSLRINLASPEDILSWSYGEVTKPETINYRRLRPEKDGLFCEAIFGPTRDYQCYCGKYKGIRYRGIICDKCNVEVTRSSVRRERMGHITLAAPVAHIWYTRRVPSHLSILLDITKRNLDRVLYFAQYIIISVDEDARARALKRLDDELRNRQAELEKQYQARIANLEGLLEQKRTSEDAAKARLREELDEELNTRTEIILSEARLLQRRLENLQGQVTPQAIVFTPMDTVLVEAGAMVDRNALINLNTLAQHAIDALEQEIRQRQAAITETSSSDLTALVAATREEVSRLRDELHQRLDMLQKHYEAEREELLNIAPNQFLTEMRYRELRQKWGQVFRAGMGAEAVREILARIDLDALSKELWYELRNSRSAQKRKKATRRLRVVEAFRRSGNRPEWLILTVLPVLPPELRPMVQLDGGRFATSDLNDLYRRVINRNNRLKRLLELSAPEVIIHNEKRMLQEAVDSLIDNTQRGKAMSRRGHRELKSLSDMLKGKKGRFRRNLLGKRVDYSGRSVIVVGPHLKMHQCGLPKTMALELYKPFVIERLVEYNYANNVKAAKRLIERERPEVWEVLEEVIKERPVLLNRAPTLHRLGIQAFEPLLIEGKAIQLHPLVCAAFNADFDGDQMAVHIPLSRKAVEEARKLMLATQNLLKPADGQPIIGPSKDMCMGVYYMTMDDRPGRKGEGRVFYDMDEVEMAYALKQVDLHARIKVWKVHDDDAYPLPSAPIETTVGRVLFNRIVPDELRFIDRPLDKGALQDLIALCYRRLGRERTVKFADDIKEIGFEYATISGVTISVFDLSVPPEKYTIIEQASREVADVERQYRRGLLTEEEQYKHTIDIWERTRDAVSKAVKAHLDPYGPIAVMANSGASKGGFGPIAQISGMRGLMADPSGRIIPLPIRSNLREGLTALEYFISTHGSRKGLADTALRTADAGYLTRRLVDTAQDVIINAHDCHTRKGIWIRESDKIGDQPFEVRLIGRMAAAPVYHPQTGELIVDRNAELDEDVVDAIKAAGITEVYVRSPMTCELEHGCCALCYGRDLGRGGLVHIGTSVGIIAAQSIGEPGTQLTLRTFHTGGVAAGGDITSGLPRVEELLEARKAPKGEAEISDIGGIVHINRLPDVNHVLVVDSQVKRTSYSVPEDWEIFVEDGDEIALGALLARGPENEELRAKSKGRIRRDGNDILLIYEVSETREYEIPLSSRLLVSEGQKIEPGTQLCEGVPNPHRVLQVQGREAVQLYLLNEVQKVYRSQGVNINDKHFEIIIRKMLSRVLVVEPGDTEFLPGDYVDRVRFERVNRDVVQRGGAPARARPVLLGVTKAALATDSFLSAASFQHTIKVLSNAAIEGSEDYLYGLKENVIIGKLIPAGTGYRGDIAGSDGPIESYEGVKIEAELPRGTLLSDDEDMDTYLISDLSRPLEE